MLYNSLVAGSWWSLGAEVVDDTDGAETNSEIEKKRGNDVIAAIISKEHKEQ